MHQVEPPIRHRLKPLFALAQNLADQLAARFIRRRDLQINRVIFSAIEQLPVGGFGRANAGELRTRKAVEDEPRDGFTKSLNESRAAGGVEEARCPLEDPGRRRDRLIAGGDFAHALVPRPRLSAGGAIAGQMRGDVSCFGGRQLAVEVINDLLKRGASHLVYLPTWFSV